MKWALTFELFCDIESEMVRDAYIQSIFFIFDLQIRLICALFDGSPNLVDHII
ncbi:hypothetical protein [Bacillus marinisedimentorum]|uniref:hypothetical protein n=1 Tax=Bacillus marinisedimentorum TaxID=1821260 RepID=UPI000B2CF585|nr:hypothetical protein [Bacillus marinisedimentorum]